MDLDEMDTQYGVRLAVFRVMFSATDVICPQQTGLFRIRPDGALEDISTVMRTPGVTYNQGPTAASDNFTYRRRLEGESCRIDVDIGEQQKSNGEWVRLVYPFAKGMEAVREHSRLHAAENEKQLRPPPPPMSPAELERMNRNVEAQAHGGNLLQGFTATVKTVEWFEGAKDCFDAVATFQIDRNAVTLLFPVGLQGEVNRFFIERVDDGANHSTWFLSA